MPLKRAHFHSFFRFFILILMILSSTLGGITPPAPVYASTADWETATYRLSQSTGAYQFWTTLPSEHVYKDSAVPTASDNQIRVYAAKNEFEPFLAIVKPAASGSVTVSIDAFDSGITAELYQVKYVNITTPTDYLGRTGANPDPLWPISSGASVNLTAGENTAFWINVFVPKTASKGDHTSNVHIGGVSLPVTLHVFDFAIPDAMHVQSQMNFSYQTILTRYGVSGTGTEYWDTVKRINQMMADHRLTAAGPLWPGGLTGGGTGGAPFIPYDCNTHTWTDNAGIWGFEDPAANYLGGSKLRNLTGFPSFMAAGLRNNDASADQRPDSFCGSTRTATDWLSNPTSTFNQKWFAYLTSMQNYLSGLGYLNQAYYYIANEPQNQDDYNAVAWYSRYVHQAAPNLKIMVSEEPKPEIYANPAYPNAHIDIWLAHLGSHFNPSVSFDRLQNYSEDSWIYFLKSTYLPRFNPFTIDHPGAEARFTGWFLWKYRLRGLAYYRFNDWDVNPWAAPYQNGQNGESGMLYPPSESNSNITYGSNGHRFVPSIRLELLRDGLEDYEYFYLLNGGQQPQANQVNPADSPVSKIIGNAVAYNRDSAMIYNLRRLVGLKIGGEIAAIPDIAPLSAHARANGAPGNYYINFQDPSGQPTGTVTYEGHTYEKIGTALYSSAAGYGWLRAADVPQADFYTKYDQWFDAAPTDLLRSSIINDYGREDVFEYDLPNGVYNVTVGVGYRGGTRYHNVWIEDTPFIENETTNNSAILRTKMVTIKDKKLTLTLGKYNTMGFINFLKIEAANPSVSNLRVTTGETSGGQLNATLTWVPPAGTSQVALRYASAPITSANWAAATELSASIPASQTSYAASLPYSSGTVYFAAKVQNTSGEWSDVSANAYWPRHDSFLPVIRR